MKNDKISLDQNNNIELYKMLNVLQSPWCRLKMSKFK